MRHLIIPLLVTLSASSAMADNRTCDSVARVPTDARTLAPALDAQISDANCTVMVNLHALKLSPTSASVAAVMEAIRPAIDVFDSVAAQGGAREQLVAAHAKADTYKAAAVLLMTAVPSIDMTTTGDALRAHDQLVDDMFALVQPLREDARVAFREVERLAPSVDADAATDPVLAFDIQEAQVDEPAIAQADAAYEPAGG